MKTHICPTCGCSLVRLGVSSEMAVAHSHSGREYRFCCQACVDLFVKDPEKRLAETNDLKVCPTCLAEKSLDHAVKMNIAGHEVHFCRCPYCPEMFEKKPDYYIQRLEGTIPHEGVMDHEGCCVRPGL